jgi:hypothetical protein
MDEIGLFQLDEKSPSGRKTQVSSNFRLVAHAAGEREKYFWRYG